MFDLRQLFSRRDRSRRFLAVTLGLILLAAGSCPLATRLLQPSGGALWIWARGDYGGGEPIAFYAVREIELDAVSQARVTITADDTYLLYVNGQRVGTGCYRHEQPVDEYEVSDFLDVGLNRIVVEARSGRGAGGLLAELDLGAHGPVVTDGNWRVFRRYDPGLFTGWSMPKAGEAPKVWGRPPTGRWRLPSTRRRRTIPFQVFPPPTRRLPTRHRVHNSDSWLRLDWSRRRIPALGPQQIFDWGAEVMGFISFDLRSDEGKPGLLYVSSKPPDPRTQVPDAVITPVPGRRYWEDAYPRRFRYVLIVGAEPNSRIEVDLAASVPAAAPAANHDGVFGIEPPRSYSKAEENVWRRLEEESAERASN